MIVVTYQAPNGDTLDVCRTCERNLMGGANWPRNERGEEFCTVSHGEHDGVCEVCEARS